MRRPQPATDKVLPDNRPLHAKRRLIVFGLGVATFLLFQVLLFLPGLTDTLFGRVFNPPVVWVLSRSTGIFPFSVAELLIVGYVTSTLVFMLRAMMSLARRRRSPTNALRSTGLVVLRDLGAIVFLFYTVWGFNYARPPLYERLGWPEFAPPDSAELLTITEESIRNVNGAYLALHGTEDVGYPTPVPDLAELNAAIDEGYARAAELLELPASIGRRYGPVKQPFLSLLLAQFGIAGMYSPWTGESHVVPQPMVYRAYTMGHEKAHQRGVNPELEASFLGYLATSLAPNPLARYSAAFYAHGRLLRLLRGEDRRRLSAKRLAGVERDRRDLNEWWEQFEGPAEAVGTAINDRFLRTNRVAGGVRNYNLVVRLLVEFHRQNGSLDPAADSP
ncbi:MAG: DUF3810 domain-containing protein [Gemmatimonadales bacterium]